MKELELILAAVASLGEAGKEAFIWWLIIDKVVVGLMVLAGALGALWMICKAIAKYNAEHQALVAMSKELGMFAFYSDCSSEDYSLTGLMKRFRARCGKQ